MKVRALSAGFYNGARVRAGQEFEVPEGTKAKWFAPVSESKAAKAEGKSKAQAPQALSQMHKATPQTMTDALKGEKPEGDQPIA